MTARAVAALATTVLLAASCSGSGADDPSSFCGAIRAASGPTGAIVDLDLDDPDAVERSIADLQTVRADAPDDISEAATNVAETYEEVLRNLSAAAPQARSDVLRDMQEQLDAVGPDAVALQAYAETTCGLRFEGPAAPTPTPTPLGIED